MICDHIGCKNEPTRGPRLVVPSRTWLEPGHRALKMMTTLHYCELHRSEVKVADLLTASIRRDFEASAKRARPLDFKCDFDAAFIEHVLITTPEYRAWMSKIDIGKLVRQHA
jgi:hypothetical protein